jgi:hypothetical protein
MKFWLASSSSYNIFFYLDPFMFFCWKGNIVYRFFLFLHVIIFHFLDNFTFIYKLRIFSQYRHWHEKYFKICVPVNWDLERFRLGDSGSHNTDTLTYDSYCFVIYVCSSLSSMDHGLQFLSTDCTPASGSSQLVFCVDGDSTNGGVERYYPAATLLG